MSESVFNINSRTTNSIKTATISGFTNIVKVIIGFGYRTFFLYILSEQYLGINGLFSNVLQMLSLAELGVTTAIVYRFYEPISKGNVEYVGMLMNFFKKVYHMIAGVILVFGVALLPLLPTLINENEQLPKDVNLYIIYILFLINTLSSYVFSYKLTILSADQKYYVFSLIDLILNIFKYAVQITILYKTRNYTLTLASGIITTLVVNFFASVWTACRYKEVFSVKKMLPKDAQNEIFKDTKACMYHKIGTTVVTGTDNAVLTKMVSLTATGLYSNYAMVINYLQTFISQILGNFTASVGNAINEMTSSEYYSLYKKFIFVDFWISTVMTVCVYFLIDDFIFLWIGRDFLLNKLTTLIICVQLFLTLARISNVSFVNATGLFSKDKLRPIIESILNLAISIVLAKYIGIAGVFLGTIISSMLTVFWREPYLLYKYSFNRNVLDYWKMYLSYVLIAFLTSMALNYIICRTSIEITWLVFVEKGAVVFSVINLVLWIAFKKTDEFSFYVSMLRGVLKKVINRCDMHDIE